MEKALRMQLEQWHDQDKYHEILCRIAEIPPEERDYDVISHLARALNNLGRYEQAKRELLSVAAEGQNDPLWHYRIGYSYFHLSQYRLALDEFQRSLEQNKDDPDCLQFIAWCRNRMNKPRKGEVKSYG